MVEGWIEGCVQACPVPGTGGASPLPSSCLGWLRSPATCESGAEPAACLPTHSLAHLPLAVLRQVSGWAATALGGGGGEAGGWRTGGVSDLPSSSSKHCRWLFRECCSAHCSPEHTPPSSPLLHRVPPTLSLPPRAIAPPAISKGEI